jgi:hypothetical protein
MGDAKNLQQTVREAWLSVLGVFTTAEAELGRATARFFESLGVPADSSGHHHLAAELIARMKRNRDELERRVDEGVKAAVARVRAPLDKELAALKARLESLTTRIEELQRRGKRTRKKDE